MVNDTQKYIVFNGKKSSDFGVWASGSQIFETPAKRVERISVPGRNGDLIIEDGSFENVELTFKDCFIPNNFAENFSHFKSFLNRQKGYQRLELSWLPDEYRLATFADSISPTIKNWDGMGKFDLTFNCKPQRFLKSGEEPITIIPPISSAGQLASPKYTFPNNSEQKDVAFQVLNFGGSSVDIDVIFYDTNDEAETSTYTITEKGGAPTIETPVYPENYTAWKIVARTNTDYLDNLLVRVIGYAVIDGETKYLDSTFARTLTIDNPTGFECKPLIEYIGGRFPTLDFRFTDEAGDRYSWGTNGYDFSATSNVGLIDCENEYVYAETDSGKVNLTDKMLITAALNGNITFPSFPKLGSDTTSLYVYSNASAGNVNTLINIYPRWFTI